MFDMEFVKKPWQKQMLVIKCTGQSSVSLTHSQNCDGKIKTLKPYFPPVLFELFPVFSLQQLSSENAQMTSYTSTGKERIQIHSMDNSRHVVLVVYIIYREFFVCFFFQALSCHN